MTSSPSKSKQRLLDEAVRRVTELEARLAALEGRLAKLEETNRDPFTPYHPPLPCPPVIYHMRSEPNPQIDLNRSSLGHH